jgi:hypothetical protein
MCSGYLASWAWLLLYGISFVQDQVDGALSFAAVQAKHLGVQTHRGPDAGFQKPTSIHVASHKANFSYPRLFT